MDHPAETSLSCLRTKKVMKYPGKRKANPLHNHCFTIITPPIATTPIATTPVKTKDLSSQQG
jgi:hypothetical protein